jgi:alpha 1,3-mannosyltransferase
MARQTAVIYELFRIYHGAVSDATFDKEANAIEHAIETLQRILYPWITKTKAEYQYYSSFLNLTASYTEQVGIVISTGKNGGFRWAVHQIVVLRAILKCSLPIEIFYGGDEDLPEKYRSFINSLASSFQNLGSITTVDITQRFPDPDGVLGLPGGWAMRPFAALASSFQTVILTDADTMFLLDPRIILNENTFKEFGSIFWHDRLLAPASDETYNWVDGLLESAKAKYLDRVRDSNWFRHQTFYEMERSFLLRLVFF